MITRFAPSPTSPVTVNLDGSKTAPGLHIGGLRTALFNYIYAKKHGGIFYIRCEDTDVERSNDLCLASMIDDLEWAGIKPDAGFKVENGKIIEFNNTNIDFGPLRQSNRKDIYNSHIEKLLKDGAAYEKDGAVYFKMPKTPVTFTDEVLGEMTLPECDCQDFVIRKSSGMPSFYFAVTCDDALMGPVTLTLRGFEHVNTAFRQIALIKALGFQLQKFAHIPLLFNQDGTKMSKRNTNGETNVIDFRRSGYTPEALLNYAAILGWSPGKNIEKFNRDFLVENFDIKGIGKCNSRFDYKKLMSFNTDYLNDRTKEEFEILVVQHGKQFCPDQLNKLQNSVPWDKFISLYHKRAKTLKDVFENSNFLINDVEYKNDIAKKVLLSNDYEGIKVVDQIISIFSSINDWSAKTLMETINKMAEYMNISVGKVAQPIRFGVTGQTVSPPIDVTLELLGKDITIDRLTTCIKKYQPCFA